MIVYKAQLEKLKKFPKKLLRILHLPDDQRSQYFFWLKNFKPYFSRSNKTSDVPIDVVIPAIRKDLEVLPVTINSIRKNIAHPIGEIFIISPKDSDIQRLCEEKNCKFVEENSVLPIKKDDIGYMVNSIDRSGWIYQQLLKLGSESLGVNEHYLVLDSDTVLLRKQSFKHGSRVILNCSDEYHQPYYDTFKKLLVFSPNIPLSFVSHYMLLEKSKLREFKYHIELNNKKDWWQAIIDSLDKTVSSSFSEYESYGHFIQVKYRNSVELEYWFNVASSDLSDMDLDCLILKFSGIYKSISFHSYLFQ
jgi:Family of unknown function (DUF6492)